MIRNRGQAAVTMSDTCDSGDPAGTPSVERSGEAPGRPRVVDRWMTELICFASGCPHQTGSPLHPPRNAVPTDPPANVAGRLQQAVRWGYQERELSRFEATLARRATVGEFLAWARERQGRTLGEVGERAGLSEEHIHGLERGHISPLEISPDKMAHLARSLDVSIWTVLERIRPSGPPSNGAVPKAETVLPPHVASPAADTVWSAGSLRRRAKTEPLALRDPGQQYRSRKQVAEYCDAVRRAWREDGQESAGE